MLIEKPLIPFREDLLFGFLPGILKIWAYRVRVYRIGKWVSIGFDSVICSEGVEIGDDTKIGFLTILRGKQIKVGSRVQIGSTTFLDTPYLEIGDGTRINEQVFVGGLQFPDSKLVVGRNCQIMQMSFINPARSITIGDDTGIGGHSLIFGHTSWLSQFEGYPVDFQAIEIGSSVSLAWRVFVLPGTKIGDGAVVGAHSVVSQTVPPRCLSMGFPARVVSKAPAFPRDLNNEEKVEILQGIIREMIGYFSQSGLGCREREDGWEIVYTTGWGLWKRSRKSHLRVVYGDATEEHLRNGGGSSQVFLSLGVIPDDMRKKLNERKITWIEIARKEQSAHSDEVGDEVTLFLRRYGVRTH